MRIELVYKLKSSVKAKDVDLSFSSVKLGRKRSGNPYGETVVQVYNGWFNVRVALVEAAGTTTTKDYGTDDLVGHFASKHGLAGTPKSEESSFIFSYNRSFGQMFIKVVDQSPNEKPAIILRRHFFRDRYNNTNPKLIELEQQVEYQLPYAGDTIKNKHGKAIGTYGTIVNFLDKNKPPLHGRNKLFETDLKGYERQLGISLSQKKYVIAQRIHRTKYDFYRSVISREADDLNKTDCSILLNEIERRWPLPKPVGEMIVKAVISQAEYLLKRDELLKGVRPTEDNTQKATAIALLKSKLQNEKKEASEAGSSKQTSSPEIVCEESLDEMADLDPGLETLADATPDFDIPPITEDGHFLTYNRLKLYQPRLPPPVLKPQSLDDTIAMLTESSASEFATLNKEAFNPDDFLATPPEPKRAKTMAE